MSGASLVGASGVVGSDLGVGITTDVIDPSASLIMASVVSCISGVPLALPDPSVPPLLLISFNVESID